MTASGGVRSLAYVGLTAPDLPAWEQFARDVLGLPTCWVGNGRLLLRMDDRGYRFDLRDGAADGLAWLGWEVHSEQDLEELGTALASAGHTARRASAQECADRRLAGMIWVTDPDGLRHEIGYGPESDSRPFTFTRPLSGYLTGGLGMGHVVVGTSRYHETVQFLTAQLRLKLTDTVPGQIAFLHCNRRHHSIGVVAAPEPGLRHVMIEAASLDDVGLTFDICLAQGAATRTLGRHSNDRAVSFYLSTPSGWEVEYGWDGLELSEDDWPVSQLSGPTSVWGHQHITGGRLTPL
jgi:2,3-dihydroxybiphenyl 1,2-dioxygenase